MARKAVLEGGKRDEIIAAATELFFTEGFARTSVRKILEKVDGEVGMFYHYFASKEELFDVVVDRFFLNYASDFQKVTASAGSLEELVEVFLPQYEQAMEKYRLVEEKMHWTIRSALHERTLLSLVPVSQELLKRFGYQGPYPLDIAAAKTIADVSAALHSPSFEAMNGAKRREVLLSLLRETLNKSGK